ncbi:unnamed protein product [Allacma fusca]|uniref:Uncharacterized protein n=1 Tax=Allacma fusca TaxID=39272 RepID=A0A8J2KVE8_9HEXA|nr:unnamed protein product [Allacma fusca]
MSLSLTERNPSWFQKEFQRLQILQGLYNTLWSTSNAGIEVVGLASASLAYYCAVRLTGTRAVHQLVVAVFCTTFLINIWDNMGKLSEISSEIIQSWKGMDGGAMWFKKYLKSLQPIRVYIGSFFYADRGIKLTILSILLDQTSSLLLSIQK